MVALQKSDLFPKKNGSVFCYGCAIDVNAGHLPLYPAEIRDLRPDPNTAIQTIQIIIQ